MDALRRHTLLIIVLGGLVISLAMGIVSAAGSFGQFAMLPGTLGLLEWLGWSAALLVMGALAAVMVPLGGMLRDRPSPRLAARGRWPGGAGRRWMPACCCSAAGSAEGSPLTAIRRPGQPQAFTLHGGTGNLERHSRPVSHDIGLG